MANLKNWLPEMTIDEFAWFDNCPKSVLFEIARQFAVRIAGEESADKALREMRNEWSILHAGGHVPQKPFDVEKHRTKIDAIKAKQEQFRRDYPAGVRLGDAFGK